ncbi:HYC_CC_PP family protein [Winogradskyella ouciana]|uniref:HYC_CC_PP family protein n=1 Tax=Winogradskyella ouciana TaxID=2608631 RepID=UPI003D2CEDE6
MKKVCHKILSFTLALVVMFSTMSFTFNMHYCGGTLVETALFEQVKGCGMDMSNPSVESCSIAKKDCCDNKQEVVDGQDELQISFDTLSFEQQMFITAFTYSYINLFEGTESKEVPFEDYPRPFVKRDVQVLHQTFLI